MRDVTYCTTRGRSIDRYDIAVLLLTILEELFARSTCNHLGCCRLMELLVLCQGMFDGVEKEDLGFAGHFALWRSDLVRWFLG